MTTFMLFALWLSQAAPIPQQTPVPNVGPLPITDEFIANRPSNTPTSLDGRDYVIGRDDLVDITVFEIPALGTVTRVSASGLVTLPLIGDVKASDQTPQQLARTVETELKRKYVNDPHVTVFVREYASQPVSVIGAVKVPGIYQIKGQKLLLDVLSMAQGLSDSAGKTIQVIRRKAVQEGQNAPQGPNDAPPAETIKIDAADLFQNGNVAMNIPIYAGDVVNVLNAGSIFTVGEFLRPGEFTLRYGKDVTLTQAIALGGGTSKDAKKDKAFVIRPHPDGTKDQIPVNLVKVFDGSQPDLLLQANDVLFVPSNRVKTGLNRALDSVVSIVIGRAIYLGR